MKAKLDTIMMGNKMKCGTQLVKLVYQSSKVMICVGYKNVPSKL